LLHDRPRGKRREGMDDVDSGSAGNNHYIAGALYRHHLTAFQDGLGGFGLALAKLRNDRLPESQPSERRCQELGLSRRGPQPSARAGAVPEARTVEGKDPKV
jgi:hypothetical protein